MDELENKYRPESATTLAETKDKKDTDYAEKINRSFREVLKDAVAKDKAAQKEHVLNGHKKEFIQARHATSRNSGTPVAVIRSPTQRIGDAPAALRPPHTEHKAAQSWLPQMALRLFGIKF